MYLVCVQVHVKPEHVDDFIRETQLNHEGSRKNEPNNVRWDLSQSEDDPTRFLLYEVYRSKADFATHQQMPHYFRWKEAVTDWMAEPRIVVKYNNLFPKDDAWNE
jgi:autoinducer 2-degrading protein